MKYFIKFVGDLDATCNDGTNEYFFSGEDYLQISDRMAEQARIWCSKNLATVTVKSAGAVNDEPLEAYVIRLDKKKGAKELKNLVKEIGASLVTIMSSAADAVDAKNVMTSKANEAFDAVEEGARLRTLLLKVAGKRSLGSASALLLNV